MASFLHTLRTTFTRAFARVFRKPGERMGSLRTRLRSQAGESVVETLAAVFICTLALLMLYTAVATAARMNADADAAALALRESAIAAEVQDRTGERREVTVDGFTEPYVVVYSGEGDGGYVSYSLF